MPVLNLPKTIISLLVLSFFLLSSSNLSAQNKYTLSGYLKDASSGETLIGANVYEAETKSYGATTNLYGFYSLTMPEGDYTIEFSYLGYQSIQAEISLTKDIVLDMELPEAGVIMDEVVVKGERKDENVESADMGKVELSMDKIKTLPALLGEVDVLKTIQLLPGVQSAGEGNSGFYVRGGGPDQNLILLDEATVFNTGHLLGFFSVFNADAIKNTTIIKGGMPAQYGGRLSSVLDINMKEGNNKKFAVTGGIGLLSSRLTVEGPLKKDQSSFIVSGRRTYAFELAKPAIDNTDFAGTSYFFYDLNAKVNYRFSEKDRVYLSGYFGRDVLNYTFENRGLGIRLPYGNSTATLRWNHLFSNKLFMNLSAIYNDYQFEFGFDAEDFTFSLESGVRDWNGKLDFDYYPNARNQVKFGGAYTYHTFIPNAASGQAGDVVFDGIENKQYAHEAALYVQDEIDITDWLKVNVGLRGSFFQQVGPYDQLIYDERDIPVDTIFYEAGDAIQDYNSVEPRFSARVKLDEVSSLKAGLSFNTQYLHLVSYGSTSLPADLWIPSSINVEPQRGVQYSLGYFRNFLDDTYETSVEVYYKDLKNQIMYAPGYVPELGVDPDQSFVYGTGTSYGAEFFFKKALGDLNGWVGYTISKTDREFDALNNGKPFPAKFDRTHDLSVVLSYSAGERWVFGGVFIYGTGNALTLPTGRYIIDGQVLNEYGDINSYRIKPYHRMDLSATLNSKPGKKWESSWTFAVYNVYNRKNTFFIYTDAEFSLEEQSLSTKAYDVALFPIIPSITYNFNF